MQFVETIQGTKDGTSPHYSKGAIRIAGRNEHAPPGLPVFSPYFKVCVYMYKNEYSHALVNTPPC